jgi:YbbR domain-containing protein
MQKTTPIRNVIVENTLWFVGCLALAFFVWIIATSQLDPVEQWRLREAIQIRVTPDPGLIITNENDFAHTATVQVRAQRSVRELLVADDIIVWADLTNLGPGEHVVELQSDVGGRRANIVDISPQRITVDLEQEASKLVEVHARLTGQLPSGYAVLGDPTFDVNQVTITGPASRVDQVAAVQVEIDLDGQRDSIEDDARPVPVDADGNPIANVTVDTQIIRVSVPIGPERNSP